MEIEELTQLEHIREALEESRASMQAAIEAARIYYFEYYPEENYAIEHNRREEFDLEERLENYPESWFERKITHPQDEAVLRRAFQAIKDGAERADCKVRNHMDGEYRWFHYTFTSIYNRKGLRRKVVCTAQDITEHQEAVRRLEEEQRFQENMNSEKLLLKTRSNVTRDFVEMVETRAELTRPDQASAFTEGVQQLAEKAFDEEDRRKILEYLSKERIERAARENSTYHFEYRRRDSLDCPFWVRVNVRAMVQPKTHDVIVFVYVSDINTERQLATIIHRVAEVEYEVLGLIDSELDSISLIQSDKNDNDKLLDYTKTYSQAVSQFVDQYVEADRREEAKASFLMTSIKERLEHSDVCEMTFGVAIPGRCSQQKKWQFAYLDQSRRQIIYSRADVTELFKEQELQRKSLRDALLQAEEASKAKTSFLSRMSHEIRTPMNAIIGMTALAIQAADQPDQVRDCLSKVGISARFLLSLINDILDMSRIESGKVTVKNVKFPMEELVRGVNSIIYEQAAQKGVDYDCVISSFLTDYYIGDSMKLQQILVNLLGNAVKFTKPGGKVQLMLHQERVSGSTAYLSFTVNDTGAGISPDFQKVMFEPFEQGDTSITSPYKGTGLGLAITKNLVNMMGGTISVTSIEGVGSEFTVRVPLESCADEKYLKWSREIPLEKLDTLIVDDDITICEHTKQLLVSMGMRAEWVESGFRAVELIESRWARKEYFDVVLLDWKMPDMDGIETARRIRKIVGEDVTIIVMTAYDWTEIEQEAKQAGVNLLVTKPLFQSTLMSVYESAFQKKEEGNKQEPREISYDFTGKQILLVEDHILNVEVARRLLESKHARVTVAENGLRALELFMEAPEPGYDAILMDIRMPVMDGLTAARSIRSLHRAGAKTVPILAMSANAFDEDVEKSRAAGMNDHLSKPIEPQVLYAALQKWMEAEPKEMKPRQSL